METLKSLTGNSFRWSLPCDVNSSVIPARDYQFLEEARRNKAMKDKEYTAIDMESESLLEHDSLAQSYQEQASPIEMVLPGATKFTTKATLQISGANVDDPIPLDLESSIDKRPYDLETLQTKVLHSKYSVYIPTYRKEPEEKKVDENGNALHQNPSTKAKKKKIQADKNVVVLTAESVEGHRSDIIDDVDKLIQFIGGDKEGGRTKSSVHKSKQLHKQHASEDGGSRGKKQRAHSSKGKEGRSELKKSNSLGEISTAKLDEFAFSGGGDDKDGDAKVVLRPGKGQNDRPKERRSWGNVEPPPIQSLYSNASAENLETSDNWVVTKPKKKSKKRRNSVSSGRRQTSGSDAAAKQHANRAPSPDLRGKSACSVPHSEKSNDSSDVDSVHSLPIDGLNAPVSYADIAKNSERLRGEKKVSPDKAVGKEKSPTSTAVATKVEAEVVAEKQVKANPPPDVHNFKSFPAIPNNNGKGLQALDKANPKNVVPVGKAKNVSPGSKGVTKGNGGGNNVKVNVVVQNDIQNDLSIIHSNEKDSIQFNAQMLPPDIPDVQTIEKMHFINRPPPPIVAVAGPQHRHPPTNNPAAIAIAVAAPPPVSPVQPLHIPPPAPQLPAASIVLPLPPPPAPPQNSVCNDIMSANNVNCDSSERTVSEDDEGPPPVVILSGIGNKEVPGLVFGFDVNEQLLSEDICENFISRYVAPEVFSHSSHNHDKIVNFIGSAWEAIVNQSNGKVQYYSEDS